MSLRNPNLNFEKQETKNLLARYDFKYFLQKNIEENNYQPDQIKVLFDSHTNAIAEMKTKYLKNRRQYNYFCEGQVRKMFKDGLLTSHLNLDGTREFSIIDFHGYGENWAFFEHWKKFQNRKVTSEKIWKIVTRIGS